MHFLIKYFMLQFIVQICKKKKIVSTFPLTGQQATSSRVPHTLSRVTWSLTHWNIEISVSGVSAMLGFSYVGQWEASAMLTNASEVSDVLAYRALLIFWPIGFWHVGLYVSKVSDILACRLQGLARVSLGSMDSCSCWIADVLRDMMCHQMNWPLISRCYLCLKATLRGQVER